MSDLYGNPIDIQSNYPVDLSNCEREPIHIPGSIQPHGALIVAGMPDLAVRYMSANAESFLGISASSILGKPLAACLGAGSFDKVVRKDHRGQVVAETSRFVTLQIEEHGPCHFHIRHHDGLLYLEVQKARFDEGDDKLPERAQVVIDSLRAVGNPDQFLMVAAHQLRQLTQYDRVMVYRFSEDGNGHVVAEDCDAAMDPYLDLHYPASDIPSQARKLYLLQRIRVLGDVDYVPVPMLAHPVPKGDPSPLDMTFCDLRSMSPIHVEYLQNMGVSATLTLSLIVDEQLWGLIVCHHRDAKLPSPALQSSCNLLSQIISFMLTQTIEQEFLNDSNRRKQMVSHIAGSFQRYGSLCEGLAASEQSVLDLVGASGAFISFDGTNHCIGTTPHLDDCVMLMAELRSLNPGKHFALDSLAKVFPKFEHLRGMSSGVLLMSILGNSSDGILWFRPEVVRTVKWGGDPEKPVQLNAQTGRISPRKSFDVWKLLVELHSLPWKPVDFEAVSELKREISAFNMTQAESLFSRANMVDVLTLLPNRHHFQHKLREWKQRTDLHPAAVILIGLDRFKRINEALGHAAGDDLLIQVARRLSQFIGNDILLARLGGDEFAMFCNGISAETINDLVQEIGESLSLPFLVHGRPFRVTASLGFAHSSHGGEEELLQAADAAMHLAKRSGRNRSLSFDKLTQNVSTSRLELEQDLYRALEAEEFRLVYQPIVSLSDRSLYGFEALIRWHHPHRGVVPPVEFISIAEETGLILPIGRWVAREAAKMLRQWSDAFGGKLTIHVNVAAPQLISLDFVGYLAEVSREHSLDPSAISIEVTESVLMRDLAVDSLRDLRNLGFGVSVDDFGTGYSSLAYLQKLPVDLVKIDRSFVSDIVDSTKSRAFLSALIHLINTLGLTVIAEGVETQAQSELLLSLGCTRAQGYYFSRPMDEHAVQLYLSANANGYGEFRVP